MAELQYRIQTTAMGKISRWRDLDEEDQEWNFSDFATKIERFEIRVKPKFVPGYYKYVGPGAEGDGSLRYWSHKDVIDTDDFLQNHRRYNVTPVTE